MPSSDVSLPWAGSTRGPLLPGVLQHDLWALVCGTTLTWFAISWRRQVFRGPVLPEEGEYKFWGSLAGEPG